MNVVYILWMKEYAITISMESEGGLHTQETSILSLF